jgi:hypothetical protein
MRFPRVPCAVITVALFIAALGSQANAQGQSSSSSSAPIHAKKSVPAADAALVPGAVSPGAVSNKIYRNAEVGIQCNIPLGWVLRTDEMNARDEDEVAAGAVKNAKPAKSEGGRVLLAAFSRPPEARAEDVNSSIVIAAESASVYPGLKDAAQYFGPLTEVVKAQGFAEVDEPYEFAVGAKTLARGDFQKDVGTRVMRQSTLVMLTHGYAVSFTFIGGTDEVEELIGGLSFAPQKTTK